MSPRLCQRERMIIHSVLYNANLLHNNPTPNRHKFYNFHSIPLKLTIIHCISKQQDLTEIENLNEYVQF